MRANLQELSKVMRPLSDERARELLQRFEREAGTAPAGFVDAEHDSREEFWERSAVLDEATAPKRAVA